MKLECFLLVQLHDKSAIFYSAENAQRMNLDHMDFVLGRDILCKNASNKGMPRHPPGKAAITHSAKPFAADRSSVGQVT